MGKVDLAGLSAVETVALPLELDGVSQRAARASGLAALEELGLPMTAVPHQQPSAWPMEIAGRGSGLPIRAC